MIKILLLNYQRIAESHALLPAFSSFLFSMADERMGLPIRRRDGTYWVNNSGLACTASSNSALVPNALSAPHLEWSRSKLRYWEKYTTREGDGNDLGHNYSNYRD